MYPNYSSHRHVLQCRATECDVFVTGSGGLRVFVSLLAMAPVAFHMGLTVPSIRGRGHRRVGVSPVCQWGNAHSERRQQSGIRALAHGIQDDA